MRDRLLGGEANGPPYVVSNLNDGSMPQHVADKAWIKTKDMAGQLGCHPNTLRNLRKAGYFKEGQHFRKLNPLSDACPQWVWHHTRTLLKMGAI